MVILTLLETRESKKMPTSNELVLVEEQKRLNKNKKVKCVVWDLDNTIWLGVLLENDQIDLFPGVVEIIKTLDSRGILQSIASKNDYDRAMSKLEEYGLAEYFLYPQINWNAKSSSLKNIAQSINIGIDTLAFIDDQPFEREEVTYSLPEVFCISTENLDSLLEMSEMNPRFITEDSKIRRLMYLSDIRRKEDEEKFVGPQEEFLATLGMMLTISTAQESDLQRAEELTLRTNQLNTTAYTYSYEELRCFSQSKQHKLLIAGLADKYGTYGKIGLALVEMGADVWTIKLLLMSCRVMSRGIGTVIINHVCREAKKHGVKLQAEFIPNERNRMMYVTYKFNHFKEIGQTNNVTILENKLEYIPPFPVYMKIMGA